MNSKPGFPGRREKVGGRRERRRMKMKRMRRRAMRRRVCSQIPSGSDTACMKGFDRILRGPGGGPCQFQTLLKVNNVQ